MPLNYLYTETQNITTLTNNELVSMHYVIKKVDCDSDQIVKEADIPAGETVVLSFIFDGQYLIELSTVDNTDLISNIIITKNLKTSIIELAEKVLCGCSKCNDCEECTNCEDYLDALIKSIALNQMAYPIYNNAIQTLFNLNSCIFSESVLLCLKNQKIYGNAEVKTTLLQIIAYYYIAFYSVDLDAAAVEDKDYITQLYKFNKISKCVRKLGVLNNNATSASIFTPVFNSIFK